MSRSGGAVLAGLGAATVVGLVTASPVIADPTPSPSGTSPSAEPSPTPSDPPSQTPSDPPTTTEPPSETPTTKPPSETPSDPPSSDKPDPTPTPTSPKPTDPSKPAKPKTPVLSLGVSVSSASVRPGGTVTATAKVSAAKATAKGAKLSLSASGATVSPGAVGLGSVGSGGRSAKATVRVPSNAKPGTIKLTAKASASQAASVSRTYTLTVTEASGASGGASPQGQGSSTLPSDTPPLTNSSFDSLAGSHLRNPQVALPPVASPQIAPSPQQMRPVAGLRSAPGESPLDFEELAALQAGWLAALTASGAIVFVRLRMARRQRVPVRLAKKRFAGKRLTVTRLRTLPPQPAQARRRTLRFSG